LSVGTLKENAEDRARKGRSRGLRGEDSPAHKLTRNQVVEIRARYARDHKAGVGFGTLAKEYGVSRGAIISILKYRTWKHEEKH
jgi:hypothetical protein